jgi:hypothetical protein
VRLIHRLHQDGFRIAVVTSSQVLKVAKLDKFFEVRVDNARLSDIEPRFTCKLCGKRGADLGPISTGARYRSKR